MQTSIIIPTYNNCSILKNCIDSIIKHTELNDNIEILISANGCTDHTSKYLLALPLNFKTIWETNPVGFVRATNNGLHKASGEFVIFLNDDTAVLNRHWLSGLLYPLQNNPKCGIVGATKWWYKIGDIEYPQVAFWCAAFRKSIFNKIGYLDDIFSPGNGEDIDTCVKITKLGYDVVSVPDDYKCQADIKDPTVTMFPINHLGGTTFSRTHENTVKLRERSAKILEERYK